MIELCQVLPVQPNTDVVLLLLSAYLHLKFQGDHNFLACITSRLLQLLVQHLIRVASPLPIIVVVVTAPARFLEARRCLDHNS